MKFSNKIEEDINKSMENLEKTPPIGKTGYLVYGFTEEKLIYKKWMDHEYYHFPVIVVSHELNNIHKKMYKFERLQLKTSSVFGYFWTAWKLSDYHIPFSFYIDYDGVRSYKFEKNDNIWSGVKIDYNNMIIRNVRMNKIIDRLIENNKNIYI